MNNRDGKRIEVPVEIIKFHQIVDNGSFQELKEILGTGVDVNAPGHIDQTALMIAISVHDLEKMKLLIEHGADPEQTDEFNTTALSSAVDCDFAAGVRFLLGLGVDRGYHPKYPLKKVDYDIDLSELELPKELKEHFSDEDWNESLDVTSDAMAELGEHPTVEPFISEVQSVDVLKLLLEAGDDLSLADSEVKRAYMGLREDGDFRSSLEDYRKNKSPHYGTQNPDPVEAPFWDDMIRLGCNAYVARERFNDSDPFENKGVVWCYDRFGSSVTELEDGRFVQIGGEHEDFYDPDFFIYNDVVIHDGQGDFQIYGYPKEVFPPTDFHTATLAEKWIYIIGCLGYPQQREDKKTPVFRLSLDAWTIEPVETSGEMPSWLHRHRSRYEPTKKVIFVEGGDLHRIGENGEASIVPNEQRFELDLSTFHWRKLEPVDR